MAEELGKIEKPEVQKFSKGRKLFFVPLIFSPPESEGDFMTKISMYWDEVETHISNLESKLGSVRKIFHEMVPEGGDQAGPVIQELNSSGYKLIKARMEKGAEILPVEDIELLTEFMDWSKCLAVGLQNRKVLSKVYESYSEVITRRNEDIAKRLDDSLQDDEIGILLMREGHHVRFPADIDVFYISPPALDEIKRWIRTREEELQAEMQKAAVEPKEPTESRIPEEPKASKEPKKPKKARKPGKSKGSKDNKV
jgi:hypothetical protein